MKLFEEYSSGDILLLDNNMEFPETSWTILAVATMNGGIKERDALNKLCQDYWEPVSRVIARRGAPSERIDDLTQEFFLQLMQKSFFKKAERGQGTFRSFILGSLRYFLADDARRTQSQKRGGHLQRAELDDDVKAEEVDAAQFDSAWAELLFDRVFDRVKMEVKAKRGADGWEILQKFLPGQGSPPSYTELGNELGLTEGGAKTEVFRLRERFRESLRAEVGRTVDAPHEIDEELAYLRSALQKV